MNANQERMYRALQEGDLDHWYWESNIEVMRRVMRSPGYKSWFNDIKHSLSSDWHSFLESEMESLTGSYKPQGLDLSGKSDARENGT